MQVQAIYKQGRLEFLRPVEVKQEDIPVTVTFPDESIVPLTAAAATNRGPQSDTREAIRRILAPVQAKLDAARGQGAPARVARDDWHQHLQEKYLGR